MRVLFLTLSTFDNVGGIQTFNKYFLRALDENQIDYSMISLHDAKINDSLKIHCCKSNIFMFLFHFFRCWDRQTIVIWNHISLAVLLSVLSRLVKIRSNILITYGTEVWSTDLSYMKKRALFLVDEIWSISSFTTERLIKRHRVPREKFRYFPCCITFPNKPEYYDSPYDVSNFNILSVLRLDKSRKLKAIYNLVDILPALAEEGIPVHLTVVGSGNNESQVKKYVAEVGSFEYVTFTGYVEDAKPYLANCDIFSLLSDMEGFGIVYLEAMQFKKACIAAKGCGSNDVVLNDITGKLVEVDDLQALAEALRSLYFDKQRRDELGCEGYKHLKDNFSFSSFLKRQEQYLLSLSN